jgi:hypothetical protein
MKIAMTGRFSFLGLFFSALLITVFSVPKALAEEYSYSGAPFYCALRASRQAIGEPRKFSRMYYQSFGLTLFRSDKQFGPRLTSFLRGDYDTIAEFLKIGGIPNPRASANWNVDQNVISTDSAFELPGSSFRAPIRLTVTVPPKMDPVPSARRGGMLRLEMRTVMSLRIFQEILVALGEKNTPDFDKDPPSVTQLSSDHKNDPLVREMTAGIDELEWSPYANQLNGIVSLAQGGRYFGDQAVWQLHYPPANHNGLSYHIVLDCRPGNPHNPYP